MEPTQTPMNQRPRFQLLLGKYPVCRIETSPLGKQFAIELGRGAYLVCAYPNHADIREGDILTLYTEVLIDAQPQPTSKQ